MSWTSRLDLITQVKRLWERGEVLSSLVTGEALFPKRLVLNGPTSAEMVDRFDDVRVWIGNILDMPHCRIEMREFRHRLFGANAVPQEAWIDTIEDALALIGRQRAAAGFTELIDVTRRHQPKLLNWLARRPLRALELSDGWGRLLDIVSWLAEHPRPGVYLRQVDIPGVDSKFIEANRGVLSELLDIVLPLDAIESTASGVGKFEKRYGFREKPVRIRFRILDPKATLFQGFYNDITVTAENFACLAPKVSRVFITENEINFLAFPQVKDSLVIFGAGYGFEMLDKAEWLSHCRIHYWGDIDTHGFAILDQLRNRFEHVESFLMDRGTLLAFESLWGEDDKPTLRDLPRLTGEERSLYDDLRDNRIRRNLRLEQERIGFRWIESALAAL